MTDHRVVRVDLKNHTWGGKKSYVLQAWWDCEHWQAQFVNPGESLEVGTCPCDQEKQAALPETDEPLALPAPRST